MPISNLINQPCTITLRADSGEADEYGDEVDTETELETVCALQQRSRREPGDQAEMSSTDWVCFFLPTEQVNTASAVTVDGETYEFVGNPWKVQNPLTSSISHIEATVRAA